MKQFVCISILVLLLILPASATGIVAPEIPDDLQQLMPPEENSFGDRLWYVVKEALYQTQPEVATGLRICVCVAGSVLIFGFLRQFEGKSKSFVDLAGVLAVSILLLDSTNSMIGIGTETVRQISQYGKLLLPVMTAALASQGGAVSAAALYSATALFDSILCSVITAILLPMVSVFLALSMVSAAAEDELLVKLRELIKQALTWCLKIILYIFTGYISITGIISGTADQTAVKAAKLTISGMVPVVGGILSDASETILVSAGMVKNAAGIYGLLAVVAITVIPFLKIGIQYLLLKITAALATAFASKPLSGLLGDFATAMGLVLAMTGSACLIQMISVVCFLKGMS